MSNNEVKESKKNNKKKLQKKTFKLMFDNDKKIDRNDICRNSNLFFEIDETETDKIRVSKEYPYGKKW